LKKQDRNWDKNIKALDLQNPELAKKLKEDILPCDWITFIKSENNAENMLIKTGGETISAYDMKDPVKEAVEACKKMNLYKQNVNVIIGVGLGHFIHTILNRAEKGHRLVIAEPNFLLIKRALHNYDFSEAILRKELIILTSVEQVVLILQIIAAEFVVEAWNLTIEKYTTVRPDEYKDLTNISSETLNQILCNTGTIAGAAGGIIADNDVSCLPYVIRHRGVDELKDLYKGKPAVLIGTGPSLAKNIHHLIDNQDKVVIIAVGQALRVLLAYGITPDFITTVDFGEVNITHFKGLMDSNVPLVTLNRTYAPLLKEWQGPKFVAATPVPEFEEMATGILTKKGSIEAGGSVAHMNLGLAYLLGCDPITFIGQDLALGETSHIPLADSSGTVAVDENGFIVWKVEDQRCHLSDMGLHGMGPVHFIPGYYGNQVMTNLGLASFLTVFEAMVKKYTEVDKIKMMNSTEGGADIKGTGKIPLRDYLQEHCKNTIDKSVVKPLLTLADDGDKLIEKVVPLLKDDIENLEIIIKNSRKGVAVNKGISKILNKYYKTKKNKLLLKKQDIKFFDELSKESSKYGKGNFIDANKYFYEKAGEKYKSQPLNALIKLSEKNFKFSEESHIHCAQNPLVNVAIYGASRMIQSRKLKVDETFTKFLTDPVIADTRMERNNLILSTAKKASESLSKSYKKTLEVLEKYNETKDDSLLRSQVEEEINLDDAEQYFLKGNWAHPLHYAKKFLTEGEWVTVKDFTLTANEISEPDKLTQAKNIYDKALNMKLDSIEKALENEKENWEKESNLLKHNALLEEGHKLGKTGDFEAALEKISQALILHPESMNAKWGKATCLNHLKKYEESISAYKILIDSQEKGKPENPRYRFEMGQVMLMVPEMTFEGIKEIQKAMSLTPEFDSFLFRIAEIYMHLDMWKEAIETFDLYFQKFDFDFNALLKCGECYERLEDFNKAEECYSKAKKIQGK